MQALLKVRSGVDITGERLKTMEKYGVGYTVPGI